MKKKSISLLLAVVMIVGMIPFGAITASAAEQVYPIVITEEATYSDMTIDMSGKTVEHIFEIKDGAKHFSVIFQNITFINVSGTGNGSCLYIDTNKGVNVYFINCRFINCSAAGNGGAVCIQNAGVDDDGKNPFVAFSDCYAVNCRAGGDGGFMYVNDADMEVYGNEILKNQYGRISFGVPSTVISGCTAGDDGGAIYMELGKKIEGFFLSDNTATKGDGGGICNLSNSATVSNCRFYRNTAKVDGGGLYTDGSTVENCKFFENECSGDGCGLYSYFSSTKINNCTFTGSHTAEYEVKNGELSNCSFLTKDNYWLSSGDGSQGNPYIIKSTDDWDALHYMALKRERVIYSDGTEKVFNDDYCLYGKYFRLDADIIVCNTVGEVHDYAIIDSAVLYTSYSEFNGIFDGNGHTVNYVSYIGSDRNGVFGYANSATVKNLTVNGYIKGRNRVGGLFGSTYNCTAENCTNNATVYGTISSLGDTASFIGGIVGHSECSSYAYCINNGKIEGMHEHIGGIVGYSNGDTINGCINNGDVVGLQKCGGIVGTAHETDSLINGEHRTPKILNCINNADVTANYSYAGGLIGYEESAVTVENCIINGTVSAKSYADWLTGNSAADSNYESLYYNKDKVSGTFGIGLSDNAMNGISADIIDEKEYIMPNILNDDIIENAPSTQNYLPVYFDDNNILTIAHSIDENSLTLGESGKMTAYCATKAETVFNDRVTVKGNVILFLRDGSILTAQKGITLEKGNTLTVYGSTDSENAGKLIANGSDGNAAIGGVCGVDGKSGYDSGYPGTNCGTLYQYGGLITADNNNGVGFGGGRGGKGGGYNGDGGNGGNGGILHLYGGQFNVFGTDRAVGGGDGGASGIYSGFYGKDGAATNISYRPDIVLYAGEKAASEIVLNGKSCQNKKYFKAIATKAVAVDCVSAIGGGYIDTTYQPNKNTRVVMDVDVRGSSEYWFGVWDETYNKKAFALGNDGGGVYAGYGNQGGTDNAGAVSSGRHTVELNKNKVYIDGEERTSVEFTDSSEGLPTQNSLYLFAQNRNGTPYNTGAVTCYGCKIYENDKLIHDFVPMKDTVSNMGFLYDTIDKNAYRAAKGYVLPGTPEENILFAEYATVGGNAHFETDVDTSNPLRVVMVVDVKSQSEDWFGCSSNCYIQLMGITYKSYRVSNRPNGVTFSTYTNPSTVVTSGPLPNGRHTIDLNRGNLYIDGTYMAGLVENGPNNQPLCLFANIFNDYGPKTLEKSGPVTFYSCKIYDHDGNLLHDYAPAVIGLTGESVLYDFVTGRVYSYNGDASKVTSYNLSEHCWRNLEKTNAGVSTFVSEATCTQGELYHKVCADCDAISEDTWEKPNTAKGHSWQPVDGGKHKCSVCYAEENHTDDGTGKCSKCGCEVFTENAFDGNGTKESPYLIGSFDDLTKLQYLVSDGISFEGKYFKLTADIETPLTQPIGGVKPFSGIFDGDGHTVTLKVQGENNVGLFGATENATIKNVIVKGTVNGTGNAVGGIVGYAGNNTVILNCINTADITGFKYVGGIVGDTVADESKTVLIENCINYGGITALTGGENAGGIAGHMAHCGTLINCFTSGAVSNEGNSGIIVGWANRNFSIENSYYQTLDANSSLVAVKHDNGKTYSATAVSTADNADMITAMNEKADENDGWYYWTVEDGRAWFTAEKPAESVSTVQKKDASCTEAGWAQYYKKGDTLYEDAECTKEIPNLTEWSGYVPAKGHTWESFSDYEHRCKVCYELEEHTAGDDYICTDCGHGVLHLAKADAIKAIKEAAGDSTDMFVTVLVNAAVAEINKEATDTVAKVIEIKNKGIAAIEKQLGGTSTHTHTFADTYTHNDTHHWRVCTCEDDACKGNITDFAVHTFTVVTNADGSKTYTCDCGYTKTVYEGGSTEGESIQGVVKCDGISLTLSSDIYINFYMQLTDEALANGKMVFTIGNRKVEGVTAQLNESNKRYYFACPLNALEMAETVTATFTYGSTTYTQTYSVKKYVETILTATDEDGKFVYTPEMQELARSIANYGYHAQYYLESIHSNVIIGEGGYKEMLSQFKDNVDVTKAKELQDKFTATANTANITFDGRTVYFDSATALNFYVIANDGKAPKATCDKGKNVEVKLYKDKTYIVSVKDISATELGDTFTVTIGEGTDSMTLKGSVLDYCAAVINAHRNKAETKDTLAINAMAAFYEYYTAAVEYAKASKPVYKVTFDNDSYCPRIYQDVKHGEKAHRPTDPMTANFVFDGWYADEERTIPWNFDTPITGDTTIYGKWIGEEEFNSAKEDAKSQISNLAESVKSTINSLNLPNDIKQDSITEVNNVEYTANNQIENAEYTAEIEKIVVKAEEKINTVLNNAKAARIEYTVSFNMMGHGTQISSQTVKDGDKATKPTDPTADGFTFGGWYKDENCVEEEWDFNTDTVNEDTTIYAKWTYSFPHHDTLDEYSWEELKTVSNAISEGTISADEMAHFEEFAENAETKKIKLNGEEEDYLYVRIIGFNHDVLSSDITKKAGITFMAVNSINKAYYSGNTGDDTSTYAAGWANSPLRAKMQNSGEIYSLLPDELTNQIQQVVKQSRKGWTSTESFGDDLDTSDDYLFLLSGDELGTDYFCVNGKSDTEGTKYAYINCIPEFYPNDWANGTGILYSCVNYKGYEFIKENASKYDNIVELMIPLLYSEEGITEGRTVACENLWGVLLRSVSPESYRDNGGINYVGSVYDVYICHSACVAPCFCI